MDVKWKAVIIFICSKPTTTYILVFTPMQSGNMLLSSGSCFTVISVHLKSGSLTHNTELKPFFLIQ
jgi:hypothetical protein